MQPLLWKRLKTPALRDGVTVNTIVVLIAFNLTVKCKAVPLHTMPLWGEEGELLLILDLVTR
jgi:hypothetical protein